MEAAANAAAQRRIVEEVINGRNLDLADDLFADEHVLHPAVSDVARGPEGMKQAFAGLHTEFPDVSVEIESIVAEGALVAVRLTFRGTNVSTGERVVWPEMVSTRFAGGKAIESWELTNTGRSWDSDPW